MLQIKRVYDPPAESDGYRLLVDRLWPRGLTKEAAKLDEWLRDIAPSPELRKWFNHDQERWEAFVQRYRVELAATQLAGELTRLSGLASAGRLTLLYAARENRHNSATVLHAVLEERLKSRSR